MTRHILTAALCIVFLLNIVLAVVYINAKLT